MDNPLSKIKELDELKAEAIQDMLVSIRKLFSGRYAVAVSGSLGKNKADSLSDIDIRTFYEKMINEPGLTVVKNELQQKIDQWHGRGVVIDGYWPRPIAEVDTAVNQIVTGQQTDPEPCLWTIWGYYLPTDITTMKILEDPDHLISGWKDKLRHFPQALKQQIIAENFAKLNYWRNDYHYKNKTIRQDILFCQGLANLLIHSIVLILYALNDTYYTGDGWNINVLKTLKTTPQDIDEKIQEIIFSKDASCFVRQRELLCHLIDEVTAITKEQNLHPDQLS